MHVFMLNSITQFRRFMVLVIHVAPTAAASTNAEPLLRFLFNNCILHISCVQHLLDSFWILLWIIACWPEGEELMWLVCAALGSFVCLAAKMIDFAFRSFTTQKIDWAAQKFFRFPPTKKIDCRIRVFGAHWWTLFWESQCKWDSRQQRSAEPGLSKIPQIEGPQYLLFSLWKSRLNSERCWRPPQ